MGHIILEAVRGGNSLDCSAQLAGITPRSLYNWLAWGEDEDREPYATFFHALKKAESEAESAMVQVIRKNAQGWQSAAWWLERRRYQTWGNKAVLQLPSKEDTKEQREKAELEILAAASAIQSRKEANNDSTAESRSESSRNAA